MVALRGMKLDTLPKANCVRKKRWHARKGCGGLLAAAENPASIFQRTVHPFDGNRRLRGHRVRRAGAVNANRTGNHRRIAASTRGYPRALQDTQHVRRQRGQCLGRRRDPTPSIDLKVNFEFDSARLDNESMLTLDALGRALLSEKLKGHSIEIVGHTDARGTVEYNDALSQQRAAAVVSYIVGKFAVDGSLVSSKGMGERQLLDKDNAEAAVNRRVEIRNVTQAR